ncbi:hypothetical protein ACFL2T_02340 [Elusimicrobiota bacterium]
MIFKMAFGKSARDILPIFIGVFVLAQVSCVDSTSQETARATTSKTQAPASSSKKESPKSSELTYKVIKSNILPGIKRSLDVRLSKKVSKKTLRRIALELKNRDRRKYDRTYIVYYLPGMKVGTMAWATTHFDPELKVNIQGLTLEEEKKRLNRGRDPSRKVIGKWIDKGTGNIYTLFQKESKVYMDFLYKDGSGSAKEMRQKRSPFGQGFVQKRGSQDVFVIDQEGNLQVRDDMGLVFKAHKAK